MTEDQFKKFLAAVENDVELQMKVRNSRSFDELASVAASMGFVISESDMRPDEELSSDSELERAAGGKSNAFFCTIGFALTCSPD